MADLPPAGFTAALAREAAGRTLDRMPASVVEVATQCLIDWLGVTVAGSREPAAVIILDDFVDQGSGDTGCTVVGHAVRLPQVEAALVNGTASHALDYDDVNRSMLGHPSVPILAGLLALGEARGAAGGDVLCAFVAGYEAECRLGRALGMSHYQRGFHATGTVGTIGAAVACGRLLGLDAPAMEGAIGLAATQAAGLKAMFGTMGKPFHAGRASSSGLLAARLAAAEFSAASGALEAEQGLGEVLGDGLDTEQALGPGRRDWFILDNLFKYHAACFETHSVIEGLRRLKEAHGFGARDVERVVVHADPLQMRMCAIAEPQTGLQAKFSLRQAAALAVLDRDTARVATFTDRSARDPEIVALRERVDVVQDRPAGGPTPVDVHLSGREVLRAAHDVSVPETDLAHQRHRLEAKCLSLAGPVLGRAAAEQLIEIASRVTELDDTGLLVRATRLIANR